MDEMKEKEQTVINDNGEVVEESSLENKDQIEETEEVMEEITDDVTEIEEYEEV